MAGVAVGGEPEPPAKALSRSPGSRSMLDVLRSWLGFQRPQAEDVGRIDSVEVTCHLRSSIPSLPAKFTYGVLVIAPRSLTWRRWTRPSDVRALPAITAVDEVRPPGGAGEWNIKRGLFRIIKASGPMGVVEFAVPTGDVRRVREALVRKPAS